VQIDNPSGGSFTITGINWYGFETTANVVHGLYHEDYTFVINEAKQYGYNSIRIPFSNQMWESDPIPNSNQISACASCKGAHARDILARIINYAGSIGLHVILDNHRSDAGNSAEANGLWYTSAYPEAAWSNDWVHIMDWVHGIQQLSNSDGIRLAKRAAHGVQPYRLQISRRLNLGHRRWN
jgi:endoglucanase